MKCLEVKDQFVSLRASGLSFSKIAQKLKVSKNTLITWSRDLEVELHNARAVRLDEIREQYSLGKEHRLKNFRGLLDRLEGELAKRDLSQMPTHKIIEAIQIIYDRMDREIALSFKTEVDSFREGIEKGEITVVEWENVP